MPVSSLERSAWFRWLAHLLLALISTANFRRLGRDRSDARLLAFLGSPSFPGFIACQCRCLCIVIDARCLNGGHGKRRAEERKSSSFSERHTLRAHLFAGLQQLNWLGVHQSKVNSEATLDTRCCESSSRVHCCCMRRRHTHAAD